MGLGSAHREGLQQLVSGRWVPVFNSEYGHGFEWESDPMDRYYPSGDEVLLPENLERACEESWSVFRETRTHLAGWRKLAKTTRENWRKAILRAIEVSDDQPVGGA